jgi:ABC-type oligopeptide transport system substrate-binding subunit
VPELDAKFARYLASTDRGERQRLAEEIQREILDNYYLVPVFRHAAMQAIGPRIAAARWQDAFPTVTTAYAYPWEDIQLRA